MNELLLEYPLSDPDFGKTSETIIFVDENITDILIMKILKESFVGSKD